MKYSAKLWIFAMGLTVAYPMTGLAFSKNGEVKFSSQSAALQEASTLGLGISNKEARLKNEIARKSSKDPKWLKGRIDDSLGDTEVYRSYLMEVRDGREQIEKAKVLARLSLYRAVKANWSYIQTSILNRDVVEDFSRFAASMRREFSDIKYVPTRNPSDGFAFEAEGWGRVLIAKNSPRARWSMDVSSALDDNRLEPGADKIKLDRQDQEFEQEPQEPLDAPVLAKPDSRQIVPQIRKSLQRPGTGESSP